MTETVVPDSGACEEYLTRHGREGRHSVELSRYGPTPAEAAIRLEAERVAADLRREKDRWRKGFTRRRVIAGAGAVGVAALGTQLVTTRYAFAAPGTSTRTMVIVFLRGGMDGLSVVVPVGDPNLRKLRPRIGIDAGALLPADPRFGLNPAMAPLAPFWASGRMAAVHAVASPDASRSHFQAQDCYERGTAATTTATGWLDRTLSALGPGTTFRAIAEGDATPRSFIGSESKLVLNGIEQFDLAGSDGVREKTLTALTSLYTGFEHPAATQAMTTLKALDAAHKIAAAPYQTVAPYPGGGFSDRLKDVARMIKANVGLRVAAIDLGGWDMHTSIGNVDGGDMRNRLIELCTSLAAFATDLGPRFDDVNLVTMSEFGRRVQENGNAGADHGHGGVMLLMGGGLVGGRVHGKWPGLGPSQLDNGDVGGVNDYRDVLSEILVRRYNVGDLTKVFPDHQYTRIGVAV